MSCYGLFLKMTETNFVPSLSMPALLSHPFIEPPKRAFQATGRGQNIWQEGPVRPPYD